MAGRIGVVEELFDKLQWMADSGNEIIRPRLEAILKGEARTRLLTLLKQEHDAVDFEAELTQVVDAEMKYLQKTKPDLFGMYRQLNNVSAAVRPMTSVVLFSIGFGPAGEIVAPFLGHAAASAVVHVFADVAGGATAAIAGEAAVSSAASSGTGMLQAWFHRLHSAFTGAVSKLADSCCSYRTSRRIAGGIERGGRADGVGNIYGSAEYMLRLTEITQDADR